MFPRISMEGVIKNILPCLCEEQLLPRNKLLIFDLDNTLIYSEILDASNIDTTLDTFLVKDEDVTLILIKERPFLRRLIKEAAKYFHIGVWTASEGYYADAIISNLFDGIDLKVRYLRDKCHITLSPDGKSITKIKKPISKIAAENKSFDRTNILVLDDNPATFEDNPENAIQVRSWTGQENDITLFQLIDVIREAALLDDVRKIGQVMLDKVAKQKINSAQNKVTGATLKIKPF